MRIGTYILSFCTISYMLMFLLLLSFDYCSTSFVPEPEVQLQHNIHLDELPCLSSVTCSICEVAINY